MTTQLLQLESVGRRHPTDMRWLLHDISCEIYAGERVAIVGRSGSGKTLILRQLAALDQPDVGRLIWKGNPLSRTEVPAFRSRVIFLHQRPQFVEGTVRTNLLLPFRMHVHRERNFELELAHQCFEQLGLKGEMMGQDVEHLSGGEQQAVALVRAMQVDPDVLLLDEPTASADPETTANLERLVMRWLEEAAHRTVVWITHSQEQVDRVATRQLTVNRGRLEIGP